MSIGIISLKLESRLCWAWCNCLISGSTLAGLYNIPTAQKESKCQLANNRQA